MKSTDKNKLAHRQNKRERFRARCAENRRYVKRFLKFTWEVVVGVVSTSPFTSLALVACALALFMLKATSDVNVLMAMAIIASAGMLLDTIMSAPTSS